MKFVRWLLIILGGLILLAGLVVGLALVPSVQRWALLRATRDVPGLKLNVARVSAGFSGATLTGIEAEKEHVVIKAATVDVGFSAFAYVFGGRLEIDHLAVAGLDVDATKLAATSSGAAAAGAPAAAPGVLANAKLPFDLTLDNVRIDGRARWAAADGTAPYSAEFLVTGGGIAPRHEGMLQFDATVHNPGDGAKVNTLRAQAGLRATLSPQRTFEKISLATVVDATGPGLPEAAQLKLGTELFQSSAGENYEVTVDTVIRGARENALKFSAKLPAGARQYAGDWELKIRTAQVEPFALGVALPLFDARGGGKFAFDPSGAASSLQGALQAQVSKLEAINPTWGAFGAVTVAAAFDGSQHGSEVRLDQLKVSVAGAQPILEAQNTGPIRYDLRQNHLVGAAGESGSLLKVTLAGVPLAWVQAFVPTFDLAGDALAGEIDLARVAGSDTAAAVRGELHAGNVSLKQDGRPLLAQATLTLRVEATADATAVEAPVLAAMVKTAAGDSLDVQGKASAQLGGKTSAHFAGTFSASTAKLLALWLPGAPVSAQGEIDATLRGDEIEVQPGKMQVQQGGKTLVNATILQTFSANLDTQVLTAHDPERAVAKVTLGKVPLGLLPLAGPNASLGGYVEQAEFELAAKGGQMRVKALGPFRLTEVSLTQDRRPALSGLAIEATPALEYAGPDNFHLQSGDITIRAGAAGTLFALKAEVTAVPGQDVLATATFQLEAPALASQPIFADAQALSAGRATGEIRAALGARRQVEARFTLNGLVAANGARPLPVANIGFRGVAQANGAVSVQAPILLDNAGRRSDLNLALELAPLGGGYSVDGRITGQQIELEDVQNVLGIFVAAAAPDDGSRPGASAGGVKPDTAAAWSKFSGQVAVDVKSVSRGAEWAMTGLNGSLAIEPTRLSLPKLTAAFGEKSRLNAKGELRFTGGPMPYRMTGDYTLNDFDVGKLFKAFDPGKPPTVDGLFTIAGSFSGNGENPSRAIDRVHGDFQLTSRQGVFRGLQRATSKVSTATKAIDLGASVLGSILGSEKAAKAAEKVAGASYTVDQLAQSLGEINYDLLSVKLSRDELLNMNLQDFSLVASELRLNGRAEVAYVEGRKLLEQPLTATLDVAARGKIEEQLNKLKVLDGSKDELGYAKMKQPLTVGGTLGRPDATPFFTKLATAKLTDFLGE